MANDTFTNGTDAPKGKRTARRNVTGNMIGYIGRTPWESFNGRDVEPYSEQEEKAVAAWIEGRDDWFDAAWED